jgi:hypothetical protein
MCEFATSQFGCSCFYQVASEETEEPLPISGPLRWLLRNKEQNSIQLPSAVKALSLPLQHCFHAV